MERLTFEGNFCDIAQCKEVKCPYDTDCSQKQVWERLKAYEDTERTPKEVTALGELFDYALKESKTLDEQLTLLKHIRELAVADQEGRVIVLPCKVGNVVYGLHGERTILPMVAKWIETNADGWTVAAQYTPMAPKFYQFSDFGKTVFLTRAEAERALAEMEGKA